MKIPVLWLRDFVDLDVDPQKLAADLTSIGLACDGIEGSGDDTVLDLDITTNRVDAMNIFGVAREVAAFYKTALRPLDVTFPEGGSPAIDSLRVSIEAQDLCPRFAARVADVRVGPSPEWLKRRLELAGQRSISNLVDLTNYVMLEMGQPSHAFDLAKVPNAHLRARMARLGESVQTLDGAERVLAMSMGVVAGGDPDSDSDRALAIAGIMGGASSEISDSTRVVALEAAYWNPLLIRRGAKALGMHTEASHRFERGADPLAPPLGLGRLCHLLVREGMGTVRRGIIDVVARPYEAAKRRLVISVAHVNDVIGATTTKALIAGTAMTTTLSRLGFSVEEPSSLNAASVVHVTPPSWRGDVQRPIDVIEEIARFHGLQNVARTRPAARRAAGLTDRQRLERELRALLVGLGFREGLHLNFVPSALSPRKPGSWAPPIIKNPLSVEQDALRTSLVVPGMLHALARNQRHDAKDLALFEIGHAFKVTEPPHVDGPIEKSLLAIALAGSTPRHWNSRPRPLDFYDIKAVVQELLDRFGPKAKSLSINGTGVPPFFHPGRSASIHWETPEGRVNAGCFGELHPETAEAFGLKGRPLVAELGLDLLRYHDDVQYASFSRFPGMTRDLSFFAPADAPVEPMLERVRRDAGASARRVALIDRFVGASNPNGMVSLTISVEFQDDERTLEGGEIESAMDSVRRGLIALGYSPRIA